MIPESFYFNENSSRQSWRHLAKVSLGFVLLATIVSAILTLFLDPLPGNVRAGSIAVQDVKADQNYEIIDNKGTEKQRDLSANNVLPVYDFDETFAKSRLATVRGAFEDARAKLSKTPTFDEALLRADFQAALGSSLPDSLYLGIRRASFSEELQQAVIALLDPLQKRPVVEDKGDMLAQGEMGLTLRSLRSGKTIGERSVRDFDKLLSRDEVREIFADTPFAEIQKRYYLDFLDADTIRVATALAPRLVKPNLSYNLEETDARRARARASVQNLIFKYQKGQVIVRRGDRLEEPHLQVLAAIRSARGEGNLLLKFLGVTGIVLLLFITLHRFGRKHLQGYRPTPKDLFFLATVMIVFTLFMRLGGFLAAGLQDAVPFPTDSTTFSYMMPVATGALTVGYVLGADAALLTAVALAVFAGIFFGGNLGLMVYNLIGGLAIARSAGKIERRSSAFRQGLVLAVVNAAAALSVGLLDRIATPSAMDYSVTLINAGAAATGGILAAVTFLAVVPPLEAAFGYTTNIQLLELANMNHPLLREMVVRAPGTYHHSQLVGILAEAGARAVGANSLLARVASYYHDIGKMKKPIYFVENQKGDNPHDRLSPSMSALIISAHVSDGLEMAQEAKLPKTISAFIPEHQGTKLIGFFYNKAKQNLSPDDLPPEEKDFRYPGPKPQSRESGIVMLSDTVEAAVRSMSDKAVHKIRALVEKLVNSHFADGQFDECDLTLKDLHLIVEAFVSILSGIYHQRMEYPDSALPGAQGKTPQHEHASHSGRQSSSRFDNVSPIFKGKNS